jgi:hypothetical protein
MIGPKKEPQAGMPEGSIDRDNSEIDNTKYKPKTADSQVNARNKAFFDQIDAAGFSIFPCNMSKKPMTTNGYKAATRDRSIIEKWDQSPNEHLWGIPAEPNGFFAVDVDPEGKGTWQDWNIDNGIPEPSPWQRTPRGGAHYLFKLPDDVKIPNNAGKLAPGIDLRSRGYICTGKGYAWQLPLDTPVAEAPQWLIAKIKAMEPQKREQPINRPALIDPQAAGEYWLGKALQNAKVGNRNQTGFELALQLRDSGLSMEAAESYLVIYADSVPGEDGNPYTEAEALASLNEAYKGTPREPAKLPRPLTAPPEYLRNTPPQEPPEPPDLDIMELIPRFTLRGIDYIMEDHPPKPQLIEKVVSPGSVNIWVGKWGSKKTWSFIDAAVCIAGGKNWLGLKTIQCPVLIIDEESGEDPLSARIKQAYKGELITGKPPIHFISGAQINLLKNPNDQILLISLIGETGARLVFIDALADVMVGGDENTVKDTQPVFMALRRIAKVTGAAIVVIHHSNRLGDYRGSSAIPGALDTMLQVESKEDSDLIIFKSLKIRDGEPVKFAGRAVWLDGQFYMTEAEATEGLTLTKAQRFTLDYFTENGPAKFTDLTNFAGDLYTENTLRKSIQILINEKRLTRIDDGGRRTEAVYGIKKG